MELDRLPLTTEHKSNVATKILDLVWFLDSAGKAQTGNDFGEKSGFFDFELKTRSVVELFNKDGLTMKEYLHAAVKQPSLFAQKPATIVSNVDGVVERFASHGLTRRNYLQAAIKQPSLFTQACETVASNIDGVVERFVVEALSHNNYLRVALKQPSLFAQTPETVVSNVDGVVERFAPHGLTRSEYLQAAVRQPSLFAQKPATIVSNIEGIVERFACEGLNTKDYLQAALKLPSLFTQKSATIARHISLLLDLYDDGVFTLPRSRDRVNQPNEHDHPHACVLDFLLRNPLLLCLEDNNLYLRKLYKEMTDAVPAPKNLLRSRRAIEIELMHQLGHADPVSLVEGGGYIAGRGPPAEDQAKRFVLRALIRENYIKSVKFER